MRKKRLTRDDEQAVVAGVIGGLAKYCNQDPVLFRVLAIAVILFSGFFPGVLLYIIAWFIVPKDTSVDYTVIE